MQAYTLFNFTNRVVIYWNEIPDTVETVLRCSRLLIKTMELLGLLTLAVETFNDRIENDNHI